MFSKIKKYVIGFFVLAGGILFAFLSGKSAGRKNERLGGLNKKIKETEKSIKKTEKNKRGIKKSLESKKKSLEEIKKQREQNPFDETIANALANGEVEMSIKKNT